MTLNTFSENSTSWIKKKRADRKNVKAKGGHIRGYAGLVHTALQISEYIPKSKIYCEPFAGLGRTAKYSKSEQIILNDKSDYAFEFLSKHFNTQITNLDFEEMFRLYDGPETVFLIDPPWSQTEYERGCGGRAFCDRTPKEYYNKIFDWLPKLKSHWFVCGKKDNSRLKNERYHHILIKSRKKIMNGIVSTLVMSNKPFVRHHQMTLRGSSNE